MLKLDLILHTSFALWGELEIENINVILIPSYGHFDPLSRGNYWELSCFEILEESTLTSALDTDILFFLYQHYT